MATARFMETWAHSLDVADTLGISVEPTDRIRHVAHIGVRTRNFAFQNNGLEPPADEFRVVLAAPSGATWEWGPEDAAQSVSGPAYDFCLRVTQRRHPDDLALVLLENTGERAGTDLVQLYARDVHASVTRPVAQLLGYRRVELQPGEEAVVRFTVPTTRLAFSDLSMRRIVEPGAVELWVGPSCAVRETTAELRIAGPVHAVTAADDRLVTSAIEAATVGAVFTDAL